MENWPSLHLAAFDPDHESYFHANTFSDHIQRHHLHVLSPHRHHFFVCVLFTAGSGWHEIDFRKYDIRRGSLFIISPGQMHNWQFSDDTEGFVLLHSLQFMHATSSFQRLPFFTPGNPLNNLMLSSEKLDALLPYFQSALHDYAGHEPYFRQTCASYLSLIYNLSARFVADEQGQENVSEKYLRTYRRFAELLEENFRSGRPAAFYAEKLGVSTRQLNRISAEVSGNTVGANINEKLLLEAQTLLADDKLELIAISEELGFNEYSYFSRWFSKQTGISPLKFRARYRNLSG